MFTRLKKTSFRRYLVIIILTQIFFAGSKQVIAQNGNLLVNPGFESGTTNWTNPGCAITAQAGGHSGSYSCDVTERTADWGGPNQNILPQIDTIGGGVYYLEAWMKNSSGNDSGYVNLKLKINGVTTTYSVSGLITNSWTKVSGTISIPTWTNGSLTDAELFVSTGTTADFAVDDATITPVNVTSPVSVNLLTNPSFATDLSNWNAVGCNLSSAGPGGGYPVSLTKFCFVSSRTADWGGPNQNVTSKVAQIGGGSYYLSAYVRMASGSAANGYASIKLTVNGVTNTYTVSQSYIGTGWTQIAGTVNIPTWSAGTMTDAEFFVNTDGTANFYADTFTLQCVNAIPPTNLSTVNPYYPDNGAIKQISGWNYAWGDEFNYTGSPDSTLWGGEQGFIRGEELQYYQMKNASVADGRLLISGKRDTVLNAFYDSTSSDYRKNTKYAYYTSASLIGKLKRQFLFGRIEVRAKIDTSGGNFPAIWTCGLNKDWPSNGEIDMMEYYWATINGVNQPVITANFAAGTNQQYVANWSSTFTPVSYYSAKDPQWTYKYHTWRMDWTPDSIYLYLDDELRNAINVNTFKNSDGSITFHNPQFMMLNLAIKGSRVSFETFPTKFEVDYFRVYQKVMDTISPSPVSNLRASAVTDSTCTLSWQPATDNRGIYRYDIYNNGEADGYFIGSTNDSTFTISGLTTGASNNFVVKALDSSGNYSAKAQLTVISSNTALAIPVTNFSAEKNNGVNQLFWNVTSAIQLDSFNIERSIDGIHFKSIGEIPYSTTNSYSFEDKNVSGSIYYYRLRLDRYEDGFYSAIIKVTSSNGAGNIKIYPCPANNNLYVQGTKTGSKIKVIDLNGRCLLQTDASSGETALDITSFLKGVYMIRVETNNKFATYKFIKR